MEIQLHITPPLHLSVWAEQLSVPRSQVHPKRWPEGWGGSKGLPSLFFLPPHPLSLSSCACLLRAWSHSTPCCPHTALHSETALPSQDYVSQGCVVLSTQPEILDLRTSIWY